MVETLFQYQRQFLASSCQDNLTYGGAGLMQAEEIKRIQTFAAKNVRIRKLIYFCSLKMKDFFQLQTFKNIFSKIYLQKSSTFEPQLSLIAETVTALGWVVAPQKPVQVRKFVGGS